MWSENNLKALLHHFTRHLHLFSNFPQPFWLPRVYVLTHSRDHYSKAIKYIERVTLHAIILLPVKSIQGKALNSPKNIWFRNMVEIWLISFHFPAETTETSFFHEKQIGGYKYNGKRSFFFPFYYSISFLTAQLFFGLHFPPFSFLPFPPLSVD